MSKPTHPRDVEIYWKDSNALPSKPYIWKGYFRQLERFDDHPSNEHRADYSAAISLMQTLATSMDANAIVDVEIRQVTVNGKNYRESIGTAIWYNKQ